MLYVQSREAYSCSRRNFERITSLLNIADIECQPYAYSVPDWFRVAPPSVLLTHFVILQNQFCVRYPSMLGHHRLSIKGRDSRSGTWSLASPCSQISWSSDGLRGCSFGGAICPLQVTNSQLSSYLLVIISNRVRPITMPCALRRFLIDGPLMLDCETRIS